jgi:hypothetical protein
MKQPFARKALATPLQPGAPLGLVLDASMTARIAALEGLVTKLNANDKRNQTHIAELKRQLEAPSVADIMVPLKKLCADRARYNTALKWCEKKLVLSEKRGGRWYANQESLEAIEAERCK